MSRPFDVFEATNTVSDPASPDYDPRSPYYVVTADSSSKYYVGPVAPVTASSEQVRAEIAAQVDSEIAPDDWLAKLFADLTRSTEIDQRYTAHVMRDADGLAQEVAVRQPGAAPQTPWENVSHEQMDGLVKTTADPTIVAESADYWVTAGNTLGGHQAALGDAISSSMDGWKGSAGDAARSRMALIAHWFGTSSQGAALSGRQQQVHAQILGDTQQQMAANPPVAFSAQEANARLAQITDPAEYARQYQADMDAYNRQKAAQQQAARYMTHFDQTLATSSTTSAFPVPPASDTGARTATTGGPGSGRVPDGTGAGTPARGTPVSSPADNGRTTGPAVAGDGVGQVRPGNEGTSSAAVTETPTAPPKVSPGLTGQPVGSPPPGTTSGPPGPWLGVPGQPGPGGRSPGGGRIGTGPGEPGGAWVGGGKVGAEPGPGGRSGGTTPRPGTPVEPTARPGTGTASGSRAGTSTGPVGPHGGRPAKDEDRERTRPGYLVDHETPEIFQSDEKATPPTIGLWRKEDEPPKS